MLGYRRQKLKLLKTQTTNRCQASMMETLPPEMVTEIAQYLPVKDVAACCQVSKRWREMFGSDEVWRTFCDSNIELLLRTSPCRVDPKFTSPESDDSTLGPIERWRTAFLREKHFWRNWNNDEWADFEIENILEHAIRSDHIIFLNSNFLIVLITTDRFDDTNIVCLMDISVEVPVLVDQYLLSCDYRHSGVAVVRSDMFIVWDMKDCVQVFEVDFGKKLLLSKNTFSVTDGQYINNFDIVDILFVGVDKTTLHIWDLEKAVKLKIESCFHDVRSLRVYHDEACENLGIICEKNGDDYYTFFLYNLKELKLWNFTKRSSQYIYAFAITELHIALIFDYTIGIYDIQTSHRLFMTGRRESENLQSRTGMVEQLTVDYRCESLIQSVGKSFIFIRSNYELVQFFPVSGKLNILDSDIDSINCLRNKETLIFTTRKDLSVELWRIEADKSVMKKISPPDYKNRGNQTFYTRVVDCEFGHRNASEALLLTYW